MVRDLRVELRAVLAARECEGHDRRGPALTPRISILLPARDAEPTIGACLASIARQTEHSWECIVVDDGSADRTVEISRRFAGCDSRFAILPGTRQGLVPALNEGLSRCRAPLIARMDADDVMRRDRLARQADALDSSPRLAAVGCHVRLFPRRTLAPRLREYEAWLNSLRSAEDVARDAFVECPVAHPTLMIRRVHVAEGYADGDWPEDYDLVLRTLARGLQVGMVPRRLLAWRKGPGTLSRRDPRYRQDRFTACKARYLASGFLSGRSTYILWGYGDTGRTLRRALAAFGKTPSHIVEVKRSRIGQRIHEAPVIPVQALEHVRGHPVVVSVARPQPRAEIRAALAAMRFVEGRDFVCAA